jgi:hypothetical protein
MPGGPGMPGMPGGPGMPGMPGGPGGMMPGFPGFGGGWGRQDDEAFVPLWIEAVVEVNGAERMRSGRTRISHKWGATILYKQDGLIEYDVKKLPTIAHRYELKRNELLKGQPTERQLEELSEWALTHGLLDKFVENMKQLEEIAPKSNIAAAFKQVSAAMDQPLTRSDSDEARRMFNRFKSKQSRHYVLFYDSSSERPEIDSRLRRLEENYQSFFYWFALKGYALTPPNYRLVAVLIEDSKKFKDQEKAFDSPPLVADGFLARRENLAVFSMVPLEEIYDSMVKATKEAWSQGWNQERLLRKDSRGASPPRATQEQLSYMQTVALLLKVLRDESEMATVSHEGTRQLLAASGLKPGTTLLPRGVAAPQWVQFGLGSFFETPKGAYWSGTGAPSWKYLTSFKARQELNKGLDPSDVALKKVITDAYFHDADKVAATANALPTAKEGALLTARTMTWSLTYYLARRQLPGLLRYLEELNKLPRDMEFDDEVLLGCFLRAFQLNRENDPGEIDKAKFNEFAKDWYQMIQYTPPEVQEAQTDFVNAMREQIERRRRPVYTPPPKAPPKDKAKPGDKASDKPADFGKK